MPAFDQRFLGLSGDAAATERVAKEFKVIYQKQPGATPTTLHGRPLRRRVHLRSAGTAAAVREPRPGARRVRARPARAPAQFRLTRVERRAPRDAVRLSRGAARASPATSQRARRPRVGAVRLRARAARCAARARRPPPPSRRRRSSRRTTPTPGSRSATRAWKRSMQRVDRARTRSALRRRRSARARGRRVRARARAAAGRRRRSRRSTRWRRATPARGREAERRDRARIARTRRGVACEPMSAVALLADPTTQRDAIAAWTRAHASRARGAGDRAGSAATRLRVGYLSTDFHDHATAHLAAGLFECHDREPLRDVRVRRRPRRRQRDARAPARGVRALARRARAHGRAGGRA